MKKLGQVFLKKKGAVFASTKLVIYPWECFEKIGVETNFRWYEKALGYLLVPIAILIYQYSTWSPWDNYRVREIKFRLSKTSIET